MKFGKVTAPQHVNFSLPDDHPNTGAVLSSKGPKMEFKAYIGCTKWSRAGLPGFYPRGIKDELGYYATQFNSLEFNATFYRTFPDKQYVQWKAAVPDHFRFFPKVDQYIGHLKRLNPEGLERLNPFLDSTVLLGDRLGTIFLQLHPNFSTAHKERVLNFMARWPKAINLAIEFRHPSWYDEAGLTGDICTEMAAKGIVHILTDTAGRRDLMHMQLTNKEAFIRFVACNHPLDHTRLEEWVERLKSWQSMGLRQVNFFIHQAMAKDRPFLATKFAARLNKALGTDLPIPQKAYTT